MTNPKRIAVATFGRSDFSILLPLCRKLVADRRFEAGLWVGGAHFDPVSGSTVTDVANSGVPIWESIDAGAYDTSPAGTVDMMAAQMRGFAAAATSGPDLVLILGDRFEAVAAGLAMVPLGVPVGHISGGSITEGAIDDVFRHCLTKIAAIHFCDLPEFARRLHRMGEAPDRIVTTGALGLDSFAEAELRSRQAFTDHFDLGGIGEGFVLATLHPESRAPESTAPMAHAMIEALAGLDRDVVMTYPNADPGSESIVAVIEEAAASRSNFHVVRSFGATWYPTAMHLAGLMVGNSSGGIIEAASFELPVVDIGDRQKGRAHGPNVLHCERDHRSISAALEIAVSEEFRSAARGGNIYGDGRGADRVIDTLASIDWSIVTAPKPFAEPDSTFRGELRTLPCD